MIPELPNDVAAEMQRVKSYFPYRIVFCTYVDEKFEIYAKTTKHVMNRLLREGHPVWKI